MRLAYRCRTVKCGEVLDCGQFDFHSSGKSISKKIVFGLVMLSDVRVPWDKRKSKHPENVFLPMLRQGVLFQNACATIFDRA